MITITPRTSVIANVVVFREEKENELENSTYKFVTGTYNIIGKNIRVEPYIKYGVILNVLVGV